MTVWEEVCVYVNKIQLNRCAEKNKYAARP